MHLLLIAENDDLVERIRESLEGFEADPVELTRVSGTGRGLEMLQPGEVDLVFLDLLSPTRSGLDSAACFCRDAAPVPVVVLSGQDDEQTGRVAVERGARDYLLKDRLDPELLVRTARSALSRGELAARLERSIAGQQRSEAYVRSLFEAWPGALALLDCAGRILDVNPHWTGTNGTTGCFGPGFDRGDDYPSSCTRWSSGSLRDGSVLAAAVQGVCEGSRREARIEYHCADALDDHWYEALITRVDAGSSVHVLVSHVETTAAREAESALQASEGRHHDVLESINDGYYEADLLGRFTLVNGALARIIDRPRREILGATFVDLSAEADTERLKSIFRTCIATGDPVGTFDWAVLTGGGSRFTEVSLARTRDSSGRTVGFRGIVRDVHLRKAIEAELEQYYVEAEEARNRAEVQAMELARRADELVHAHNEALAATQIKTQFVSNMSHEILTPMNGIVGMADLLAETRMSREQAEYVETIRGSTNALLTLVNGLLDFSKLEEGRLELETIPFSLRASVAETLKPLSLRAHGKQLELLYDFHDDVPDAIIGDPSRLRQILVNLTDNAIKFTRSGEIILRVSLESRDSRRATVRFDISDTGIGIPKDKQREIFNSFSQADGSTTRRYGGAGLGLSISSQLAQRMGRGLWVESEEAQGSTFSFTVDFRVTAENSCRHELAPFASLEGLRAIVADDNSTSRRQLLTALESCNVEVRACDDGRAALELLARAADEGRPFDVAVLDCQMPVLDGFTATRQLRDDARLAETKIVLLTLFGQRGDAARCRKLGVSAYLTKPIAPLDLLDSVRALITPQTRQNGPELVTRHSLRETRRRLSVLVAGANPVSQMISRKLLHNAGHKSVVVNTGQEALRALETERFDVVLIDMEMPEVEGIQTTEAIRTDDRFGSRHIPIVALTANDKLGTTEHCLSVGMDAWINQPFELTELVSTLDRLLPNESDYAEEPADPAVVEPTPQPESAIIDRETLLERVGGDRELLGEIAAMFFDERKSIFEDLSQAVSHRRSAGVEQVAQRLKSTFGTLAAGEAAELASDLERLGRERRFDDAELALAALENKIIQVERELAAIAGTEAASPRGRAPQVRSARGNER